MKMLFVSTHVDPLAPPVNGDAQRTRLLYEACARIADVDVVTFAGQPYTQPPLGKLKKWTALLPWSEPTDLFPVNPQWEAVIDEAIQKEHYDAIVARYFFRAIPCGLWKYRDKLVLDFDDALPFFFLNQLAPSSAITTRIRLKLASRRAKVISRNAVRKLRAAFFAEEAVAKANHGTFLPNIPFYTDSCPTADMNVAVKRVLFVGQLDYQPNKEGLDHFLEQVYRPLVERMPNVEMHVVGMIRDEALRHRWQRYPGVTVTGFVDDLKAEYEQSHVVVVPVYRCGATNIKLLEAMAMKRACITTQEAYAKINGRFQKGEDLYSAADDCEFVDLLERLLIDENENRRIAHNGKSCMDRYYSLDAFCDIVKKAMV